MIMQFFSILVLILVIGLIPVLIDEMTLHQLLVKYGLVERNNFEKIFDEMENKVYLLKDYYLSDVSCFKNCDCVYYFSSPVRLIFDIDSDFESNQKYLEFFDVDTFCLSTMVEWDGGVECQVKSGDCINSVFLFDDIQSVVFKVVE